MPPGGKCTENHSPKGRGSSFVPAGWWHVVLNVETSVALSHSLSLRRDLETVFPPLIAVSDDAPFTKYWLENIGEIVRGKLRAALHEQV